MKPLPKTPEPEAVAVTKPTPETAPAQSGKSTELEFSDVWHPGRAVGKGLRWAGDQLPFGDRDEPPAATKPAAVAAKHAPAASGPIPLWAPAESAEAPAGKSDKPGPGSGGLY